MAGKRGSGDGKNGNTARSGAPDGFTSDKADFSAPWVKFGPGVEVMGRLLGAFTMPDQFNRGAMRHYVQVQLGRPTTVTDRESGEGATRTAERGEIVSLGITAGSEVILDKYIPLTEAGAKVDIYVSVTGARTKTRNNNLVWPLDVRKQISAPPTGPIVPYIWRNTAAPQRGGTAAPVPNGARAPRAGAEQEDSDIPF